MSRRLDVAPPLSPTVHLRRPRGAPPWPLGDGCLLFRRARQGLWHGLRTIGLRPEDAVLVPAYHHGSEVEALIRAGLRCRFYEATVDLEPSEPELEALLTDRVRALHLIHPLGVPRDAGRWRRWCDRHGLLLLEDAAQSWLSTIDGRPTGSIGDLSIFSLYKQVPVPDGGAVVPRIPAETAGSGAGLRGVAGRHLAWLRQRVSLGRFDRALRRRSHTVTPAEDMALGDVNAGPAKASLYLLARLDHRLVAERRRESYRQLSAALGALVPPPFDRIPPGSSPMGLPILVADKERAQRRLEARGVGSLDFWALPHPSLAADRFPGAAERRRTTLLVPSHQGLSAQDLDRIVTAVREAAGSTAPA